MRRGRSPPARRSRRTGGREDAERDEPRRATDSRAGSCCMTSPAPRVRGASCPSQRGWGANRLPRQGSIGHEVQGRAADPPQRQHRMGARRRRARDARASPHQRRPDPTAAHHLARRHAHRARPDRRRQGRDADADGDYYITALLKQPDPNGIYGPYAFAFSGHSPVLNEFAGGNGRIGIHGTERAVGDRLGCQPRVHTREQRGRPTLRTPVGARHAGAHLAQLTASRLSSCRMATLSARH